MHLMTVSLRERTCAKRPSCSLVSSSFQLSPFFEEVAQKGRLLTQAERLGLCFRSGTTRHASSLLRSLEQRHVLFQLFKT